MPLGKRQRRWLLALGIFFGALLLLCLSVPLWFPWLLSPLAVKKGVRYQRYQRQGYRRFAVYQVSFTNAAIRFRAERLEALTPSTWLWRTATGKGGGPWVRIDGWALETVPSQGPARPGAPPPSLFTNVQQMALTLPTLERWLPAATLSNGLIQIQENTLDLPAAAWSRGKIWARVGFRDQQATLSARVGATFPYDLQFQSDTLRLQAAMQLATNADGLFLRCRSLWWSNRVDLQAEFGHQGLLPERASVQVPNLRIAPQWLGLEDYYRDIRGAMSGTWEQDQFHLSLNASARPLPTQTNLPPLNVELRAQGNAEGATIQTAAINAPWLKATLSRELQIHFAPDWIREPATLSITADLSRQLWIPWQGRINGLVEMSPGAGQFPQARFNLTALNTGVSALKATNAVIEGAFNWPWLEIAKGNADFDDGSRGSLRGRFDVTNRTLAGASVNLSGPLPNRWLPSGCRLEQAELTVNLEGPLNELRHQGHLRATQVTVPTLRPLQLEADWQGTNRTFSEAKVAIVVGKDGLLAQGAVQLNATETAVLLNQLVMSRSGSNLLALAQPVRVSFKPGSRSAPNWSIETGLFDWRGDDRRLQAQAMLAWPRLGNGTVVMTNVQSDLFQSFFTTKLEPVAIQHVQANFHWTNGPAAFGIDFRASGLAQSEFPLAAEATVGSDGHELIVTNLLVTSRTSAVTTITGRLPLAFDLGATNPVRIDFHGPLELKATITPQGMVWEKVAQWTGITLRGPACQVNVAGTWAAPAGQIHLQAEKLQLRKAPPETPSFEHLTLDVELDRDRARVKDGRVVVQGQPVLLTGEFPMGESVWAGLIKKRVPDWENASAHLRIEDAQLAAFAPLLPEVLSPQGELNLDLSLLPGGKLDGDLSILHGRTRPLGSLGPIRDISVQMKFVERALRLQTAEANIGGSIVVASGNADLGGGGWLRGELPPFHFALTGTNVPLSRQPDSIIRSDLDLAVIRTNNSPALISGTVKLRDSFYLRDVRDLLPGRVSTPERRPPYFSVAASPLGDWRLAARVTGTRFLKIRSTLFNGEVSANLRLEGTLREPAALGDLKIDSGTVRFPFANLEVRQGFVTLSSSAPYRPQLQLQAESKRLGYEVRMDASGPADAPIVQFSSTPPLSSEQIVLMLTAGEVPRGTLTLTPQQKAQTVAVFFGRDLLTRFGLSDESEDRITVQSGEQLSEQGRPTYNVEYKLTDRWSLVGEYDRFNAFNAGLKWRVYSK